MQRDSKFAYTCHACQRCCQNKLIRVNPYEVMHLARELEISTTAFLQQYVDRNTSFLRLTRDGQCAFLDARRGCTVHAHRPLVCRLYPLGRNISGQGVETFTILQGHPESQGSFAGSGTVADYLNGQGAQPYIVAVDLMLEQFHDLFARMAEKNQGEAQTTGDPHATEEPVDWLDADQVIKRVGGMEPDTLVGGIERMFDAYLNAIRETIALMKEENDEN